MDCRFIGSDIYVLELLPRTAVRDAIHRLSGPQTFTGLLAAFDAGTVGATVNGITVSSLDLLPDDADVLTLQEGAGATQRSISEPDSVETTEPFDVVLPQRPDTPPLPEERTPAIPRRWHRHVAFGRPELALDVSTARSSIEDRNSRRCSIFDPLRQVEIVYTPACAAPFRFLDWAISRAQHLGTRPDGRVINHEFGSFPGPQICIHPPLRGDFVALPIEVTPGIVCTVVAPRDFSALQLMIQLERDCSVTRMQRILFMHGKTKLKVNGVSIDDIYAPHALVVADTASITPHFILIEHGVAPDVELLPPHWQNAVGPLVVHRPLSAPLEVNVPSVLSPSGVRHALIAAGLLDNPGSLHMPYVCPVIPGIGLHLLALDRAQVESETCFCIFDLRRAVHPPLVPFWVSPVIVQASRDHLIEILHDEFPTLGPVLEIFYDTRPLHQALEHGGAPWLTVMAFPRVSAPDTPVLEPALTSAAELSRLRPGYRATFSQLRRYQSSTSSTTQGAVPEAAATTTSTTAMSPFQISEPGSSGNHVTTPVRLVFSLPGMVPRARIWKRDRNLAQVLWPLVAQFAPYLPRTAHLQLSACSRVYKGRDGVPEILLTIEHPEVFDFSVWVRDQADQVSLRLTAVAPGMTITEIVASCFPLRKYANTLLDAVRSDDQPVCRNGMIISVCDDWRRDESFPLADWHFVLSGCGMLQFPLDLPAMLLDLPAPCLDSAHPHHQQVEAACRSCFMSQFLSSCARFIKWHCELVTDKHIRVILPGRGVCRLKWLHRIAPTADELRPVIAEIWPEMSLTAICDTFSFQQDACIYLVQGTSRLYTAWIYMDPLSAATDARLVPCGFHPVSCLPSPHGTHVAILQSHGAWGLYRHAAGDPPPLHRSPHHSATIAAWEEANHNSSDSADFRSPEPLNTRPCPF